jgi:radical SAM superfamily enzyme YgiQ (UPF0313 family)
VSRPAATRARVVLYNPAAVFWTMPLSLLAVGSALDRSRYDVRIVDARLESDPLGTVLRETDGALCLGISVLTGAPIRDALRVGRAVKAARPGVTVVWGGWHPSLFPTETLAEPSVDVTVQGQGEATFAELLDRLAGGDDLEGLAGTAYRSRGQVVRNPPRPLVDLNRLPPHDYGLVPVEGYFLRKRRRQLDYVASTGCLFRCAFCADPFVFGRSYRALAPERVGAEADALFRRHGFGELAFQDETFFTYRDWVARLAEELLRHGRRFAWTATLRADQAVRLGEDLFAACVRSGLRRVMVGVESGSQETLDLLRKDITVDQVAATAEACVRHGLEAIFPFIVGLPGETEASVRATLALMKRLRAMSPGFETPLFYFKPYPGSSLTDRAVAEGYRLPDGLEAWADFDFIGSSGPWVGPERRRLIERFKFYSRLAWGRPGPLRRPLQRLARWRCERDAYGLPLEKLLLERLRPQPRLS